MAWHRDAIGLLFEQLLFSAIALSTFLSLGEHINNKFGPVPITEPTGDFHERNFFNDDSLFLIFIPLIVLDCLLICKVRLTYFLFSFIASFVRST